MCFITKIIKKKKFNKVFFPAGVLVVLKLNIESSKAR